MALESASDIEKISKREARETVSAPSAEDVATEQRQLREMAENLRQRYGERARAVGADITASATSPSEILQEIGREKAVADGHVHDQVETALASDAPNLQETVAAAQAYLTEPPPAPAEHAEEALAQTLREDPEFLLLRQELDAAHKRKVFGGQDPTAMELTTFMDTVNAPASLTYESLAQAEKEFRARYPEKAKAYDLQERARVYVGADGTPDWKLDPAFGEVVRPTDPDYARLNLAGRLERLARKNPDKVALYAHAFPEFKAIVDEALAWRREPMGSYLPPEPRRRVTPEPAVPDAAPTSSPESPMAPQARPDSEPGNDATPGTPEQQPSQAEPEEGLPATQHQTVESLSDEGSTVDQLKESEVETTKSQEDGFAVEDVVAESQPTPAEAPSAPEGERRRISPEQVQRRLNKLLSLYDRVASNGQHSESERQALEAGPLLLALRAELAASGNEREPYGDLAGICTQLLRFRSEPGHGDDAYFASKVISADHERQPRITAAERWLQRLKTGNYHGIEGIQEGQAVSPDESLAYVLDELSR